MSNRYRTISIATGSIASGANSDTNSTSLPNHFNIVKVKVEPSASSPFDCKIFKKDTFVAADLLAWWDNVQPNLYYPTDNDTGGEAEEGPPIPYDDEDGTNEFHIRVTNNDSVSRSYTITILYEEAPAMAASGAATFRAGISAMDADVAHGVTDVTATTNFFHVDIDSGTDGGARVWGFSDAVGQTPLFLHGVFGSTDPTDTVAAVKITGSKRSGTGRAVLGDAETLLDIMNLTTSRMTMLGNGAVQMVRLGLGVAADANDQLTIDHATDSVIKLKRGGTFESKWEVFGGNTYLDSTGTFNFRQASDAAVRMTLNAATGSWALTGVGPHAIGGATNANSQLIFSGTHTGSTTTEGLRFNTTLNGNVGSDIYAFNITGALVEAGSSTHGLIAGIRVAPTVTAGAATVTDLVGIEIISITAQTGTTTASGIRVAAPTGATNNWAINVTSGQSGFASGTAGAPGLVFTGDVDTGWFFPGNNTWDFAANGSLIIRFDTAGIKINDTSNANMTTGLTINQGAADNEILALKSSDVAHGITDESETDTYGRLRKLSGDAGGLQLTGFSDETRGLQLIGFGVTENTVKTTGADGAVMISTGIKSGTAAVANGADANLLVIRNLTTTRFIFDAEGSAHADVEWTTFDKYDDVALMDALDMEFRRRQGQLVNQEFTAFIQENREILQREKIFNFYDEGPRAMMNMSRAHMLEFGAIRQLGRGYKEVKTRQERLEERCELYEKALIGLGVNPEQLMIAS